MSSSSTIVFFGRDPGGTNQVIAIYDLICRVISGESISTGSVCIDVFLDQIRNMPNPKFKVLGKDSGLVQWSHYGIDAQDIGKCNLDEIRELFGIWKVNLVITGTSDVDDKTDQALWRIANSLCIKSIGCLQFPYLLLGLTGVRYLPN